jgi:hypothetical protein
VRIQQLLFCLVASLAGCVSAQLQRNAGGLISTVSELRQRQVLNNLSATIDDNDAVPVHVVITQGSAQVSSSAGPTFKLPRFHLSQPTKELDLAASDQWTDQWQFIPVTATDDLMRLRTLYGLIIRRTKNVAENEYKIEDIPLRRGFSVGGHAEVEAAKLTPLVSPPPTREEIVAALNDGISDGCSKYLRETPSKIWLYWKNEDTNAPSVPIGAKSLGKFGRNEIFVTSRACFDDFILLVQSTTTNTATQAITAIRSGTTLVNP